MSAVDDRFQSGGASLCIAEVHSIAVLGGLFLCFIVQMTEVAAISIENVPAGSVAITSSLQVSFNVGCRRNGIS